MGVTTYVKKLVLLGASAVALDLVGAGPKGALVKLPSSSRPRRHRPNRMSVLPSTHSKVPSNPQSNHGFYPL
jgi:hypothetical protein